MSAIIKGLKRICMSCGTRFYDMNRKPIICPSCETEFTGEIKVKSRRGRAAVANDEVEEDGQVSEATEADDVVDDELEDDEEEVVSLDDVEEEDDDDLEEDDLELDDDIEDLDDLDDDEFDDEDEDIAEDDDEDD